MKICHRLNLVTFAMLTTVSAAIAVVPAHAGNLSCGTTLESWTGKNNCAIYRGILKNESLSVYHKIVLCNGLAIDPSTEPDSFLFFGKYDPTSVQGTVFKYSTKLLGFSNVVTYDKKFSEPQCDSTGQVTNAQFEIIDSEGTVGQHGTLTRLDLPL